MTSTSSVIDNRDFALSASPDLHNTLLERLKIGVRPAAATRGRQREREGDARGARQVVVRLGDPGQAIGQGRAGRARREGRSTATRPPMRDVHPCGRENDETGAAGLSACRRTKAHRVTLTTRAVLERLAGGPLARATAELDACVSVLIDEGTIWRMVGPAGRRSAQTEIRMRTRSRRRGRAGRGRGDGHDTRDHGRNARHHGQNARSRSRRSRARGLSRQSRARRHRVDTLDEQRIEVKMVEGVARDELAASISQVSVIRTHAYRVSDARV